MSSVERFRDLHRSDALLLMPNAWDVGSAKMLEYLGFQAPATTSGGAAASRGVADGDLDAETVFTNCAELVAAVDVPVSADLEGSRPIPRGSRRTSSVPGSSASRGHRSRTGAAAEFMTWPRPPSGCKQRSTPRQGAW